MANRIENLFPTTIVRGTLAADRGWNRKLLKDIESFSSQDKMGREWSKGNYRGGYTSYASLSDLHRRSPIFAEFAERLQPHAEAYAKLQGWSMKGLCLDMTACWVNIMPKHVHHTLHLHPHSVLSGAYYVRVPKGSVSLRLEDPRMGLYMNAPVGKKSLYHEITPKEGTFVLFESWLRHEVPPNQSDEARVSLSFNYSFDDESAG